MNIDISDSVLQPPTVEAAPGGKRDGAAAARGRDQVAQLAREFEALMMLQMLRQMRQASMFGGDEDAGLGAATMGDTIDLELTRQLASVRGTGLRDALARGLEREAGAGPPAGARERMVALPAAGVAPPTPRAVASASLRTPEPAPGRTSAAQSSVSLPIRAPISSHYGWRQDPLGEGVRFHSGVDIAAAYGREVGAVTGGRVTFAGESAGYGNNVVVEHPGGMVTRYAHLSEVTVRDGETIEAGTVLGRVGQTGRATGPHLHFEMRVAGRPVDPEAAAALAGPFKTMRSVAD